jgi:ligand-binding sensor domain-containing protein
MIAGSLLLTAVIGRTVDAARPAHRASRAAAESSPWRRGVVKRRVSISRPIWFEGLAAPLGRDTDNRELHLPDSTITSIAQDSIGFLWFGTSDGLARYDGRTIVTYQHRPEDPTSISSNVITSLQADASGHLWIGTIDAGLNRYDLSTDKFTSFRHDPNSPSSLASDGVSALLLDKEGKHLWIGFGDGGVDSLEIAKDELHHRTSAPLGGAITSIVEGEGADLWLASDGGGLWKISPESRGPISHRHAQSGATIASDNVTALLFDHSGSLWVGTKATGLDLFDPKSDTFTHHRSDPNDRGTLSSDEITVLLEEKDGTMWIGTRNGLHSLDSKRDHFVRFARDSSKQEDSGFPKWTTAAFQDRGGMIWLGEWSNGLRMFDRLRFKLHNHRLGSGAMSFAMDAKDTLWVGTYDRGLIHFDRSRETATVYERFGDPSDPRSIPFQSMFSSLYVDGKGTLWAGLAGTGLIAFNPSEDAYRVYEGAPNQANALNAKQIPRIISDGRIMWLATWGGGLNRFDPGNDTFTHFSNEDDSLASDFIYTIAFDRRDPKFIWIGTADAGLLRFDTKTLEAKSYRETDKGSQISHDGISIIHQDASGTLWLGTTGGGLKRFDPTTQAYETFTSENGLPNDTVDGILEDPDGKLWISTNGGGIAIFDPKTRQISSLRRKDGLIGDEFVLGSYMKLPSGEMLFGGVLGFNAFFPNEIRLDDFVPPVTLTSFEILGQKAQIDRPIWTLPPLSLRHADSMISFEFAALSYASPSSNRFSYMLEGFDEKWINPASDEFRAKYTNLDGGNYKLRVRASNRHGKWNEQGVALNIHVDPAPWRSWWAYCLYGLVLVGAALSYARYQSKRIDDLKKANRLAAAERELDLTGAIQTGCLPKGNRFDSKGIEVYGFYRPAERCSGDWWWYEAASAGAHFILVGDVTGHGAGPAMVTAAVATAFRQNMRLPIPMAERLLRLNEEVRTVGQGRLHMTMSAVEFDELSGEYTLHSAGGLPALALDMDGSHPKLVMCPGSPLGTDPFEAHMVRGRLKAPGSRLLVLTDGLVEQPRPDGKPFGMRAVTRLFAQSRDKPLEQAVRELVDGVDAARKDTVQEDDWTVAMFEWRDPRLQTSAVATSQPDRSASSTSSRMA